MDKMLRIKRRDMILAAAGSVLISLALFMNLKEASFEAVGEAGRLRMLYARFLAMFEGVRLQLSVSIPSLFALLCIYRKKGFGDVKIFLCRPVSLLLGYAWIYARVTIYGVPFFTSRFQMGKVFLAGLGFSCLYDILIHLAYLGITRCLVQCGEKPEKECEENYRKERGEKSGKEREEDCGRKRGNGVRSFLARHPFGGSFALLLLLHLPHLLIKYPAVFTNDAAWQLEQGLGLTPLTTHHPILHTMLITWCTRLGLFFGSANGGIFLFVLLQTVTGAAVMAYGIAVLSSLNASPRVIFASRIFFGLFPFVTGYLGQVLKDVLYADFFLLFMIELTCWCALREKYWSFRHILLLLISSFMTCLLRNNGIYLLGPTLAVMAVMERRRVRRAAVLLFAIAAPILAMKGLESGYHAQKGSIAEALSLPIQQTARCAALYDDATPEEIAAIDAVLPYAKLRDKYNPLLADPVKNRFKADASREELTAYLGAWFSQGLRHPLCYLQATLIQNVSLLDPQHSRYTYLVHLNSGYSWKEPIFHEIPALTGLQDLYSMGLKLLLRLPVLSLLFGNVTYVILSLFLFLYLMTDRAAGRGILFLPLLLCVLVIFAGPCIHSHMRYAIPIVYSFPILLGYYTSWLRSR